MPLGIAVLEDLASLLLRGNGVACSACQRLAFKRDTSISRLHYSTAENTRSALTGSIYQRVPIVSAEWLLSALSPAACCCCCGAGNTSLNSRSASALPFVRVSTNCCESHPSGMYTAPPTWYSVVLCCAASWCMLQSLSSLCAASYISRITQTAKYRLQQCLK
jgi:hypothetical protein